MEQPKDLRGSSSKVAKAALVICGVTAGVWASLVLADILTFVYFYFSTTNVLQDYELPEYVAKFVAVLFASLVTLFTNFILRNMIKLDRKRWVSALAGIMAFWFVIMAAVASPYESGPFNIFSAQPGKYYRDQYGKIQTLPRGAKIGDHGEPVQVFTKESAQEYERQTGTTKKNSVWHQLFGNNSIPDAELQMEIEKIDISPYGTALHFAVSRKDNSRLGRFYQPHGWNYLSDETRQTYDLVRDNADYPNWLDAKTHEEELTSGAHALTRIIRPDEVYRFIDEYPPLKPGIRHLRLYDSRFAPVNPVDLDNQLKLARIEEETRIRTEQEIVKQKTLEAEVQKQKEQEQKEQLAREKEREEKAKEVPQKSAQLPNSFRNYEKFRAPQSPTIQTPQLPSPPLITVVPSPQVIHEEPKVAADTDWMIPQSGGAAIRVDRVKLIQGRTVVNARVRTSRQFTLDKQIDIEWGMKNRSLSDERGRVYRFRMSAFGRIYKSSRDGTELFPTYRNFLGRTDELGVGEVCLFTMIFDPLRENTRELTLNITDYPPMNISWLLR